MEEPVVSTQSKITPSLIRSKSEPPSLLRASRELECHVDHHKTSTNPYNSYEVSFDVRSGFKRPVSPDSTTIPSEPSGNQGADNTCLPHRASDDEGYCMSEEGDDTSHVNNNLPNSSNQENRLDDHKTMELRICAVCSSANFIVDKENAMVCQYCLEQALFYVIC
ncbi:hypothetical protein QR680_000228 [Steinernema hermaphroditum]|uniref:Uncharacterized protein n=1 Tax=Steinernema hermaphroditum TaxID=289476 RepID=A0AA39LDR4_9BILA|nr:hypothetical protein QR680_000228 [Steinernema hermaphroditum]